MSTRRHLASTTALAAFVVLAFGSEATDDGSSSWDEPSWDEPAAADDDPAPAPAAGAGGSGDCAPWSGTGSPVASIEDLFDASKLQSMGRKLDFNVECYDIDEYDGDKELDCSFWNEKWAFDIEVSNFRSSQDAKWEVEDPWIGEAYERQGNWVLGVDAQNGSCAKALLDGIVPAKEATRNFDEDRIKKAIKAAGWQIGEYGCSMEKYDGTMSFDCPTVKGKKLEGSVSISYEIEGGSRVDEERELDSGYYYIRQAYGYGSCSVDDTASAENLLKALLSG
jgi:hypothetical protein